MCQQLLFIHVSCVGHAAASFAGKHKAADRHAAAAPPAVSLLSSLLCAPTPSPSPPAQGYPPLVSWARDLVVSLHQPATLQKHGQTAHTAGDSDVQQQHLHSAEQQPQQQQHEPVGMDVVITPGASAALDSLVRVLVNPGDPVLVEEFTYAHMAEAHLLPLG